jgi:aryl-alcohol dehydrogenase-like predicted oxidoreductase
MEYVTLGGTGLKVSRLCLGCMSFGQPGWDRHPWVLDERTSMPFYKRAFETGINFFDTADFYSYGVSEQITGKAVREFARREEVVIATKLGLDMNLGPNGVGLSRKHIREAVDASLKRLGTDYVDILYIHRLDPDTPLEEVMVALDDVVTAGKALYLGASSMWTWQFATMRAQQKANCLAEFVVMQNFYNLIYREEEREMNPYCAEHNVALVPWSPIARGFLAGNRPKQGKATDRAGSDELAAGYFGSRQDYAILARVEKTAARLGVKPAQVALAWVLDKVTAPIVGGTKMAHLEDAIAALDITLDARTIAMLEAPYKPREIMGHS